MHIKEAAQRVSLTINQEKTDCTAITRHHKDIRLQQETHNMKISRTYNYKCQQLQQNIREN